MNVSAISVFVLSIVIYFLFLNGAMVLILEPKFLSKLIEKNTFFQKYKTPLAAIFLILLFITSFWLGMIGFLLKIYNSLLIL